ncbi:MAG TPA: SGNH/GDSL hydrolase family protein [Opitutus sp.]|nr:SGNH/GDSL hydrolase family protein [Opitutus sp.]
MKPSLLALAFSAVAFVASALAEPAPAAAAAAKPKARPPWEREWAYFSRYRDANAQLPPPAPGEQRVVFMGDSITEMWAADTDFFARHHYIGRGISGQTSAQMLVRFRADVIDLQPAVVVILAGTNDIAGNGGETTLEAIENNLRSMTELARCHDIHVVLASILPAVDFPWRRGLEPADKIAAVNRWIADYCQREGLVHLDYYSAMADKNRGLPPELSADGVHPTPAGFAIMAPLAEKAIAQALNQH